MSLVNDSGVRPNMLHRGSVGSAAHTNCGGDGGGSGHSTPCVTLASSSGPPPMHHCGAPPSGPRHMQTRSPPNCLPRNSPPHFSYGNRIALPQRPLFPQSVSAYALPMSTSTNAASRLTDHATSAVPKSRPPANEQHEVSHEQHTAAPPLANTSFDAAEPSGVVIRPNGNLSISVTNMAQPHQQHKSFPHMYMTSASATTSNNAANRPPGRGRMMLPRNVNNPPPSHKSGDIFSRARLPARPSNVNAVSSHRSSKATAPPGATARDVLYNDRRPHRSARRDRSRWSMPVGGGNPEIGGNVGGHGNRECPQCGRSTLHQDAFRQMRTNRSGTILFLL